MSDATHPHEDGPHEGPIKTPKQLILAVFFAFVVPIIAIILLVIYVAADKKPAAGSDAMSAQATAERIRPVGVVEVEVASDLSAPAQAAAPSAAAAPAAAATPTPPAATTAAAAAATTPAAPAPVSTAAAPQAAAAPALYAQNCAACHATGVANAPKLGDKAAWAPRVALGVDGLTASAIKGKGAMPPKGGSTASEADIKAVVSYMVSQAK